MRAPSAFRLPPSVLRNQRKHARPEPDHGGGLRGPRGPDSPGSARSPGAGIGESRTRGRLPRRARPQAAGAARGAPEDLDGADEPRGAQKSKQQPGEGAKPSAEPVRLRPALDGFVCHGTLRGLSHPALASPAHPQSAVTLRPMRKLFFLTAIALAAAAPLGASPSSGPASGLVGFRVIERLDAARTPRSFRRAGRSRSLSGTPPPPPLRSSPTATTTSCPPATLPSRPRARRRKSRRWRSFAPFSRRRACHRRRPTPFSRHACTPRATPRLSPDAPHSS